MQPADDVLDFRAVFAVHFRSSICLGFQVTDSDRENRFEANPLRRVCLQCFSQSQVGRIVLRPIFYWYHGGGRLGLLVCSVLTYPVLDRLGRPVCQAEA